MGRKGPPQVIKHLLRALFGTVTVEPQTVHDNERSQANTQPMNGIGEERTPQEDKDMRERAHIIGVATELSKIYRERLEAVLEREHEVLMRQHRW